MKWLLYFIPALIVELVAWWLTPVVCLFVERRYHTDIVKRDYNKQTVTLIREFLPKWLSYFQTHDNAVDEFWYGEYESSIINATPEEYANSWWVRYVYRCLWLFRNTAYGFHYNWFSVPKEEETVYERGEEGVAFWLRYRKRKSSFQLQYHIPIAFTKRYIDGNIGFKGHRGFDKMMIANRVIGLRQYD